MRIALVHHQKAFLPELDAYHRFFAGLGVECVIVHPAQLATLERDVEWFMMGTDLTKKVPGIVRVHEFASASVPPAKAIKDLAKRFFMTQPDFRLFLNSYVRDSLSFTDKVPYGFRDMGLWPEQIRATRLHADILYDFVYVGSVSPDMKMARLLDLFGKSGRLSHHSLLLISRQYDLLQEKYRACTNIIFSGPYPQADVATQMCRARFAINYKPDVAPHNQQTSTKLLEYIACGIPVVTTDLAWVRQFQHLYGGRYFYLDHDLSNFTWDAVTAYDYAGADLSAWTWDQQIRNSGILDLLRKALPNTAVF